MNTGRIVPHWARSYRREQLAGDLTAGLVVAMLLVPQAMAYAALAGLPPHIGLYASVLPLAVYALAGSSTVLSVGPVAVVALMTASALEAVAPAGSPEYLAAASVLALLSGAALLVLGLLRLGAMAHLLSHPVISGFMSGAAILILIGQLRPLLGPAGASGSGVAMLVGILADIDAVHVLTAAVGLTALLLLWAARTVFSRALCAIGLPAPAAGMVARLAPMLVVIAATLVVRITDWERDGLRVVGELPSGLPTLVLPIVEWPLAAALLLPALIIGLIGFVESVSIAGSLGRARHERVDADAELRGLGIANMASAVSGAFPVAGGLSRTAVSADAGANTPLAGILTALIIALILLVGPGVFATLPTTVLAAIIIIAVLSLIDVNRFHEVWRYDRPDATALVVTAVGVVVFGVEVGVGIGVGLSLASLVWRSSRPHIAVLGQMPGTEHFRNVLRHNVRTRAGLLMLRVDENLFFGNAEAVARRVQDRIAEKPDARHVVLVMSSVSYIDATALETLEALHDTLATHGIRLHFAEVKGPVFDRLEGTRIVRELTGRVFLSAWEAFAALPEPGPEPDDASARPETGLT